VIDISWLMSLKCCSWEGFWLAAFSEEYLPTGNHTKIDSKNQINVFSASEKRPSLGTFKRSQRRKSVYALQVAYFTCVCWSLFFVGILIPPFFFVFFLKLRKKTRPCVVMYCPVNSWSFNCAFAVVLPVPCITLYNCRGGCSNNCHGLRFT